MKIAYEKIQPDAGSSIRVIHSKSQGDRYFWHYHPEYEIVYIHRGSGRRHVGSHLANYEEGELVFLGPNLPHAGFGYGVEGEHEEIVVQLREDFLGEKFLESPEMSDIKRLFGQSRQGVHFFGKIRREVAKRLVKLPELNNFERLIEVMQIFQLLATSQEYSLLNADGSRFDISLKEEERINKIHHYVEENFKQVIDIRAIADLTNLTVPSFCRYFKKMTHLTFTDFINEFRVNHASKLLSENYSVADACFESGFNNVSHFNKTFRDVTGKSPSHYKKMVLRK